MKIRNEFEAELFCSTIRACVGSVTMTTPDGQMLNLKDEKSLQRAVALLMGKNGNAMELFARCPEDMGRMFALLRELKEQRTARSMAA